jgi:hypothetical protein
MANRLAHIHVYSQWYSLVAIMLVGMKGPTECSACKIWCGKCIGSRRKLTCHFANDWENWCWKHSNALDDVQITMNIWGQSVWVASLVQEWQWLAGRIYATDSL